MDPQKFKDLWKSQRKKIGGVSDCAQLKFA